MKKFYKERFYAREVLLKRFTSLNNIKKIIEAGHSDLEQNISDPMEICILLLDDDAREFLEPIYCNYQKNKFHCNACKLDREVVKNAIKKKKEMIVCNTEPVKRDGIFSAYAGSEYAVPIVAQGEVLGVISVLTRPQTRYNLKSFLLIKDVAKLLGGVTNYEKKHFHNTLEKNAIQKSLTLAQEVQQKLLPQNAPEFPGFEIAGKSVYCDETGGDYFDYFVFPEKKGVLSIVVGDVSGHGIASALLMATARALLRMRLSKPGTPAQIISDLNRYLAIDVQDSGRFMTLFYLELDTTKREISWVRAGHDPALRYIPSQNKFEQLDGDGMALGVVENQPYNEHQSCMVQPGDILLIGTDGIWETRNSEKHFFGKNRFFEVIRQNHEKSAGEIVDACFKSIETFRGSSPAHDDITLVVIKVDKHIEIKP